MLRKMAESNPKLFSLRVHQSTQNENEIMVSEQSSFQTGDIVEIYKDLNSQSSSHVLLTVTVSDEMIKGTDSVSIVDTICNNKHFNFKTFNQVYVKKVVPEPVDLIVLTCKDTYLSRSDMWRMKQHLENKCIYIDKRVTFIDIIMQITVSEIWLKGESLACGYISNKTRICFRSSSSVLHIFLQMSVEMWEYDNYGDLYFEKAVSGFLTDLFEKWKKADCDHEITIVMFSRTFYEARSIEEFPEHMREAIQPNASGEGFYEDFYRVVIKNERYDNWRKVLMKMKQLFINYEKKVLRVEERELNPSIPKAYNSSAAQGNYLEVLNMSLNLFEKYFLDRNFDRLGKVAVVITPGPGVFEVDKDLMTMTKQRTIDTGSAADLICMGEQPLHTVPLFKVRDSLGKVEIAKIPSGWINHSFYTSQSQMRVTSTAQFVPRIKLASKKTEQELLSINNTINFSSIYETDEDMDYDAYDRNVFIKPAMRRPRNSTISRKHNRYSSSSRVSSEDATELFMNGDAKRQIPIATSADNHPDRDLRTLFSNSGSRADDDEHSYVGSMEKIDSIAPTSSTASLHHKHIDPFNPNSINRHPSANRRRWVHAFPLDKNGMEIQPHHIYIDGPRLPISSHKLLSFGNSPLKLAKRVSSENKMSKSYSVLSYDEAVKNEYSHSLEESMTISPQSSKFGSSHVDYTAKQDSSTDAGGKALEPEGTEFSSMTKTGVDWRSLITPALLPITTDYYPSDKELSKDYVDTVYTLDPLFESPMNYAQFFKGLASIRLALGFQLVQPIESAKFSSDSSARSTLTRPKTRQPANKETYRLSVGKIFHELDLQDDSITVKLHRPKKERSGREVPQYKYQFMCPDSNGYYPSVTRFITEQAESYKWNILDNYVINRGFKVDGNEDLLKSNEGMKYWCSRFCVLPTNNNAEAKRIRDTKAQTGSTPPCDTFISVPSNEYEKYNENFIRFIELVNGLHRKAHQRSGNKSTKPPSVEENGAKTQLVSSSSVEEPAFDLSKVDSSLVDKIKDVSTGFPFLDCKAANLPSGTFISYEAVAWIENNCNFVHSNAEAVLVLQKLLSDGHIEHVSKAYNQYKCGFYLFFIVSMHSSSPVGQPKSQNTFDFGKEWVEVEFAALNSDSKSSVASISTSEHQRRNSKSSQHNSTGLSGEGEYKSCDIDTHLSQSSKADLHRVEWISFKYFSYYHPSCGYDLELDWIVATGCLLSEMVNSWRRKLNNYGFQLLPIPVDPFAMPTERNSDPLRCPIFVPFDDSVTESATNEELLKFMTFLIGKFGFLPITYDETESRPTTSTKFIHTTGGFFLIIQGREGSANRSKVGFQWSWNFMVTKQWWQAFHDFELFEDTIFDDFKQLTSNKDNRLSKHWQKWKTENLD